MGTAVSIRTISLPVLRRLPELLNRGVGDRRVKEKAKGEDVLRLDPKRLAGLPRDLAVARNLGGSPVPTFSKGIARSGLVVKTSTWEPPGMGRHVVWPLRHLQASHLVRPLSEARIALGLVIRS